jgi:serine/threonine protein phosphatase PrpC
MRFVAAAKTDVGQKRQGNEDRFCLDPALGLYVVADGMGGHAAGEVASRLAVETIQEWMEKYLSGADAAIVGPAAAAGSAEANFLLSSIRLANRIIFDSAQDRREYTGMGTTVVAVLALGDRFVLANVGDSRIYRIRRDQIVQVSRDHSFVQQQVDNGMMSPVEAHQSQYRHMITRALGLKESVDVDLAEESAQPGDVLVLCSDGLSDLLDDEEILAAVQNQGDDLDRTCQALVDRANAKGGDDNVTVLVIRAEAGGGVAPPDRRRSATTGGGVFAWLKRAVKGPIGGN